MRFVISRDIRQIHTNLLKENQLYIVMKEDINFFFVREPHNTKCTYWLKKRFIEVKETKFLKFIYDL